MTLSSILRSAIKYKPSSAAAKLFSASVSGAASPPIREINDAESLGKKNKTCDLPRLPVLPHTARPLSREKGMWLFSIQVGYMDKCERSETLKECNQMIKRCIQRAGIATNETGSATQMEAALIIFKSMKDWGLPLEEETYGPLLEYLIDKQMLDYFHNFLEVIENENPSSCSRIRHYQKLFLRKQYDKLVQEQYDAFVSYDGDPKSLLPEPTEDILLVLCGSGQTKDFVQLLDSTDITKFSSVDVARVSRCFERLLLESTAEKVLLEFKACDCAAGNTSILIYRYVLGIPNLTVEDVMSKFKNLHRKLEVTPSSVSYEKLIIYCCDSLEVHVALELVDEMIELGMTCSLETLHSILQASTENCDFNLVLQIHYAISRRNLKPNSETFRRMIDLCVRVNTIKSKRFSKSIL
uniref:pentatricopeptide repeat-containing protein At4g04790, mitochondrial-like isoform X2 n=1 Tax=Fragaria vesca subsp. vesca TaxID=101020 RepID=UPI0005C9C428|nr:PREDICTED: pentatricopeptide repeat-containing protein At4g04790, mitochondrial-like isoform X2 [Fragaria vesca subsp. vesca]